MERNTKNYEPSLCFYAEAFYKKGDYEAAARVAIDAHQRALSSENWKDNPPPAPVTIAGKSYRAIGKQAKKSGDVEKAIGYFGKIIELGVATDNDKKVLEKLQKRIEQQ